MVIGRYHQAFVTTTTGLDRNHPAMRLFEKAKRFGIWDPGQIDFSRDIADWQRLREDERDILLRLTSLFQAGEEAVTLDLLPLIRVIAAEGRLEEEIYLTSFLWEEAKHTEFFHRFLAEVAGVSFADLSRYHSPHYRTIIYEALPAALRRLDDDPSPAAQVAAAVTYNMIVEGVLADVFDAYDPVPFDLKEDDFIAFATAQFDKRMQRLEKARRSSPTEVYEAAQTLLEDA